MNLNEREILMKLQQASYEDLKKMPREEIHENYKKITKLMLFDFLKDMMNFFEDRNAGNISVREAVDFVDVWADAHFKPMRKDWRPTDG